VGAIIGQFFWLRAMAAVGLRRPTVWICGVVWLMLLFSTVPAGVSQDNARIGAWWSSGLATPGYFALELTIFHIIVITDLQLAARANGVQLYANAMVGRSRWFWQVLIAAVAAATVHVALWCALAVVRCYYYMGSVSWSITADDARLFPGDSGVFSMIFILFSAVVSLSLIGLLVAALVHSVSWSIGVIALAGFWCLAELSIAWTQLGLELGRFFDPGIVVGPDAVRYYAALEGTWRWPVAGAVAVCWCCIGALVVVSARRFRALAAPG
jgi:hypothetical protein